MPHALYDRPKAKCKPAKAERNRVEIIAPLEQPANSRASNFLNWASTASVIKKLGFTKQQINEHANCLSCIGGLVGLSGSLPSGYRVRVNRHDERSESSTGADENF